MTKKKFQSTIYEYYTAHKRVLPWRTTTDPYKIMVSEIMLQQTQVDRVIPKFEAFIKRFPTVQKLAQAKVADILSLWSGLGYNRRALFLKRAAEEIVTEYKGTFPIEQDALLDLSGIGPYTASAIRAFAYNKPSSFIETNIRSVFIHFFFKDCEQVTDAELFPYITKMLDTENPREWYSALMDYGTMLKATIGNASRKSRHYTKQSKFQGSPRQVRGEVLKFLITTITPVSELIVLKSVKRPKETVLEKLDELVTEGFIIKKGNRFSLAK